MQNVDLKILGKIKKCLALASSDNPHEAAAALRQAHALMALHGVSAEQITMADIGESKARSRTMARGKPAHWEGALASVVGRAFGCQLMILRKPVMRGARININDGAYIFVGLKAQAEIASYTFDVLARKCKAARTAWIKKTLGGVTDLPGGKRMATGLGDEFAVGWVAQIAHVVQDFAQPEEVNRAITALIESQVRKASDEELTRQPKTQNERLRRLARVQGQMAANGESIHRPMNGAAAPLQISSRE